MPAFDINSWYWKVAIVLAIIFAREVVRLCSRRDANGERSETGEWLIDTLNSGAVTIGLVFFVIQPFLLQPFLIPTGSMEDTFLGNSDPRYNTGDRVLVSKLVYHLRDPQFQDVVVFRAPPAAAAKPPSEDFIKRCIGTPGDIVYAENRRYFRKAHDAKEVVELQEPYVKWNPEDGRGTYGYDMKIVDGIIYSREHGPSGETGIWTTNGMPVDLAEQRRIETATPGPVPADSYLMLGDHRSHSLDSHAWGFVPRANIVGKAVCIFWPIPRIGLLDNISSRTRHTTATP